MKETFDNILTSALEMLETNPYQAINNLMDAQARKYGVADEVKKDLKEIATTLDKIQEKATSLAEARKQGITRTKWLVQEVERMSDGRTQGEKDALATAIVQSIDNNVENELENIDK